MMRYSGGLEPSPGLRPDDGSVVDEASGGTYKPSIP